MGKENRGFASLTPERRKAISKKGSDKALLSKDRHKFTTEEAREAVRKRILIRQAKQHETKKVDE